MTRKDEGSERGFRVNDRRAGHEDGHAEPEAGQPREGEAGGAGALPPIDFSTFVLSLSTSAIYHLGEMPHPETGKPDPNLPLAKQTIDILGVLQEKTRGNLTADEDKLLTTLLYDLRMQYIAHAKK